MTVKRPNPHTFPDGTAKTQGTPFTAYLTEPRSSFKYTPKKTGRKRQHSARFGDLEKSAIYTLGGPQ